MGTLGQSLTFSVPGLLHWTEGGAFPRPPPTPRNVVVHIDMDCFFASVALLDRPDLVDKPVVVAHGSAGERLLDGACTGWGVVARRVCDALTGCLYFAMLSDGEISSANYVARSFGISAGMWMSSARKCCPDVVVLPYNFERIRSVSECLYRLLCEVSPPSPAVLAAGLVLAPFGWRC